MSTTAPPLPGVGTATQDRRPSRRLRAVASRAGGAAAALLVFALSAVVVFSNPDTAQASTITPSPVTIGETLAGAGEVAAEVGGETACVASVVCGVGEAVTALAVAAYVTRDSWVPVLKGLFSDSTSSNYGSPIGCLMTATATPDGASGLVFHVSVAQGCHNHDGAGAATGTSNFAIVTQKQGYECSAQGGGGAWQNPGIYPATGLLGEPPGPWTKDFQTGDLCPAGSHLMFASFQAAYDYWNAGLGVSQAIDYGTPVPADLLSQTTKVDCTMPDGSTQTISVTEGGVAADGKILVPSCSQRYPGSVPHQIRVTGGYGGSEAPGPTLTLPDIHQRFPDCFDANGAFLASTCRVRVWVNGQPCVNGMAGCYDPQTYADDHPGTSYDCRWGSHEIPFSACSPLFHHYGTDPATQTVTVTQTTPAGAPITDPTTPTSPSSNPSGDPSTGTAPAPAPAYPSTGTNPSSPSAPADSPSADPKSSSCYGAAWSWNPVDWVYVPVKCVLQWAFVPSPASVESFVSTTNTAWSNSAPGRWANSVSAVLPTASDSSGCEGPGFSFHSFGVNYDGHPFTACAAPMSTAATVVRIGLSAAVVFGGFFVCLRAVGAGLGWNPGVGGGGVSA